MKYYQPELEEFHIGFELEIFSIDMGIWGIYVITDRDAPVEFKEDIELDNCRVKYLDEDDIKDLGWKFKETFTSPFTNKMLTHFEIIEEVGFNTGNKYILCTTDYPSGILISKTNYGSWGETYQEMNLTIKNKGELKRLMKQLGI